MLFVEDDVYFRQALSDALLSHFPLIDVDEPGHRRQPSISIGAHPADLVFTGLTAQNSDTIPVCRTEMDLCRHQLPHGREFATHTSCSMTIVTACVFFLFSSFQSGCSLSSTASTFLNLYGVF